jgi:23S rRNA (cytidine1920-2'-O)/16S rRNA (cytidine1409-2'-O)-methyltransferase
MRLDRALVARQLSRSRTRAHHVIKDGAVWVNDQVTTKPSREVADTDDIAVQAHADQYVSRAAYKLLGALDDCAPLGLTIAGRRSLDAGASTGGFTQVLLERGVTRVWAIDVGHDQLDPDLSRDPRVHPVEGVNVRDLTADSDGAGVDLVVADLSFISLTMVIDALVAFAAPGADMVLMVKPQFEVGRESIGRTGVVVSVAERARAVSTVVAAMRAAGVGIHHIARSALPGPHGNVEFFVWGSTAWQARAMAGHSRTPVLSDRDISAAIVRETERQS